MPRIPPLETRFKPGQSGNPNGRPKGAKNFKTLFEKAVKSAAQKLELGEEPDAVEIEIIKRMIREALAGKYPFAKDILDRLYGKPKETIDINADLKIQKIEQLEEQLAEFLGLHDE
jgi:hypothetical protein